VDVFEFKAVIDALAQDWTGARVLDVNSFGRYLFGVNLSAQRCSIWFLFSTSSGHPGVGFCSELPAQFSEAKTESNFGEVMRSHLANSLLTGAFRPPGERRVELVFNRMQKFDKSVERVIVIEIMGRHSGAFLLSDKRIVLGSAKLFNATSSRFRTISVGKPYIEPPPLSKLSPELLTWGDWSNIASQISTESRDKPLVEALLERFTGLTRESANRILQIAGLNPGESKANLVSEGSTAESLFGAFESLRNPETLEAVLGVAEAAGALPEHFAQRLFFLVNAVRDSVPSIRMGKDAKSRKLERLREELAKASKWRCLETVAALFYEGAGRNSGVSPSRHDIAKLYSQAETKAKLLGCLREMEKLIGTMLASRDKMPSPGAIASRLAAGAARYQRAIPELEKRIAALESGDDLKNRITSKQNAEIRETTAPESTLAALRGLGIRHRLYFADDGTPIVLGLSARSNDALYRKFGSTPNWFFHVRDAAGSWVIALTGKAPLSDCAKRDAAIIAAANSKLKGDNTVEVSYTQMKNLRKPKGLGTGKVLIAKEKTIAVKPADLAKIKDRDNQPAPFRTKKD
jgi:predicted ribosome quality control (RQC) complex YloA/Tae2 family protein